MRHLALLLVAVTACGKPELKRVIRERVVIDKNETANKITGELELLVHSESCPSDRSKMTVPASDPAVVQCYAHLAVGSTVESVTYIYRYPLFSTGVHDLPQSSFGGCPIAGTGVGTLPIGTPCH